MQLVAREDPIAWVSGYVGVPWLDRGRTADGADSWGLVRLVLAGQMMLSPRRHTGGLVVLRRGHRTAIIGG